MRNIAGMVGGLRKLALPEHGEDELSGPDGL
jgi:hypothetical protein